MRLVKKLIGVGVTAVMGLTFATGALADSSKTTDLDVTIKGAGLSLEVPTVKPMNDIVLTKDRERYYIGFDGDFVIKDLRGTQAGWRLDVAATRLTEVKSGYQLPFGSLWPEITGNIKATSPDYDTDKLPSFGNSLSNIDAGPVTLVTAEEGMGMGSFEISFKDGEALFLQVDPVSAKEGTYESTITWNLVTAP